MTIKLQSPDPASDGHRLELRRLLDGTLILRIFAPGKRAGIGLPGSSTLADIASALAKRTELRILTRMAYYSIFREGEWIRVGYTCFESGLEHRWKAATAEVLAVLRELGRRAA